MIMVDNFVKARNLIDLSTPTLSHTSDFSSFSSIFIFIVSKRRSLFCMMIYLFQPLSSINFIIILPWNDLMSAMVCFMAIFSSHRNSFSNAPFNLIYSIIICFDAFTLDFSPWIVIMGIKVRLRHELIAWFDYESRGENEIQVVTLISCRSTSRCDMFSLFVQKCTRVILKSTAQVFFCCRGFFRW